MSGLLSPMLVMNLVPFIRSAQLLGLLLQVFDLFKCTGQPYTFWLLIFRSANSLGVKWGDKMIVHWCVGCVLYRRQDGAQSYWQPPVRDGLRRQSWLSSILFVAVSLGKFPCLTLRFLFPRIAGDRLVKFNVIQMSKFHHMKFAQISSGETVTPVCPNVKMWIWRVRWQFWWVSSIIPLNSRSARRALFNGVFRSYTLISHPLWAPCIFLCFFVFLLFYCVGNTQFTMRPKLRRSNSLSEAVLSPLVHVAFSLCNTIEFTMAPRSV